MEKETERGGGEGGDKMIRIGHTSHALNIKYKDCSYNEAVGLGYKMTLKARCAYV